MIYKTDFIDICSSFDHLQVVKFLRGLKWEKIANKNEKLAIFQKMKDEILFQITLPLDRKYSDYGDMMYQAATVLANEQSRNVEEIVLELMNPLSDIVKVRVNDDKVLGGTVLFEDAIDLFNNAKKMIQYAAQDAISPRKYYGSGRICDEVHRFIDGCRFGQTEVGSYIVNIVCPFVFENQDDRYRQMTLFDSPTDIASSLTRKATQKLMDSLGDIKQTIDAGEDIETLTDRKTNPISVNFLESVENLNLYKTDGELEVSLKWAPTVDDNKSTFEWVKLDNSYYAPLQALTDRVKRRSIVDTEMYVGRIKSVSGNEEIEERKQGIVKLVTISNDRKKTVRVKLNIDDYDQAIEAHRLGQYVKVVGKYDKETFVCSEFTLV